MADEKESGYVQDLAKGRLQQARDDLKSAQLNFSAGLFKGCEQQSLLCDISCSSGSTLSGECCI